MFRFLFLLGTYRNPVREEKIGSSCAWKKKPTGIRYAKEESDQAAIGRRTYRNPVREEKSDQAAIRRRMYRNPVHEEKTGTSCARKKNVPKSGTQRKNQIKQR